MTLAAPTIGCENVAEQKSPGGSSMGEDKRKRLLAVVAHPDDETFGCGGLLAKCAAEGVRVSLVCATRGEVGEISDPSLATAENLAQVREGELRQACAVLGVEDLFLFDYRDSGMAGTADNENPRLLHQADKHTLTGQVAEIIRRVRPQVLLTFDANPDHIAIHQATRQAFAASGDPATYPEHLTDGVRPHQPTNLYYLAFTRSMVRIFHQALVESDVQTDFRDMDPETMGMPDEEVTTVVDVSGYLEKKERAGLCHRTQIQGDQVFALIPEAVRTSFLSREHLVRAEPPFAPGRAMEGDIFDGVQV